MDSNLLSVLSLVVSAVVLYFQIVRRREDRAERAQETSSEIATAPIKAQEREDALLDKVVSAWDRSITKLDRLAEELHIKNELDRQSIEQTAKQLADSSTAVHELRSDLAITTNALGDHVKATAPAVAAIIEQKQTIVDTHQKVGALPGAVRTEMQEDFKSVKVLVEELRTQLRSVEAKVDLIASKLETQANAAPSVNVPITVNPAPAASQPTSVPEMTKPVEVVESDPSPTTPMPGGMPNGQPPEVKP